MLPHNLVICVDVGKAASTHWPGTTDKCMHHKRVTLQNLSKNYFSHDRPSFRLLKKPMVGAANVTSKNQ